MKLILLFLIFFANVQLFASYPYEHRVNAIFNNKQQIQLDDGCIFQVTTANQFHLCQNWQIGDTVEFCKRTDRPSINWRIKNTAINCEVTGCKLIQTSIEELSRHGQYESMDATITLEDLSKWQFWSTYPSFETIEKFFTDKKITVFRGYDGYVLKKSPWYFVNDSLEIKTVDRIVNLSLH